MLISNSKSEWKFGLNPVKIRMIGGCLLSASLSSCQTPVLTVQDIPSTKINKTVYLSGSVTHLAPFVGNAAYQLQDSTGKVWVVTTENLPELGKMVNIRGKIHYQSLPFAQQDLGDFYIVEQEQLSQLP